MAVTVRRAVTDDADAISALLLELGYRLDPLTITEKIYKFEDSGSCAYVAVENKRVVGIVSLSIVPVFYTAGTVARITSLVVDQAVRGHGAGRALVAQAEAFAWEHGCFKIEVSADARLGAQQFYVTKGYQIDEQRFFKLNPAQQE